MDVSIDKSLYLSDYIENLDRNTLFSYIFFFIILVIILANFSNLSTQNFFSIFVALAIMLIYYFYKSNVLKKDLKKIENYDQVLNLKYFPYLRKDLSIVQIYNDLKIYGNIDKYNFIDSMKSADRVVQYYEYLKRGNIYYGQILDLAKEQRDNALNYLTAISKSLNSNIGIISNIDYIQDIEQEKLFQSVLSLKKILDRYIFLMMNISRIQFETEEITNFSRPISYNPDDPEPNNLNNEQPTFDIYQGFVLP